MSVYVGIDVHRKRSQVAVIDAQGEVLVNRNVPNGVEPILKVIGGLPPGTPAAFEAAFGTGWLVELLQDYGFDPHLVHPLRCKAIASARLKNDKVDAEILAQLLRADLLPEAWIAPPAVRQLRALLRHRVQLPRGPVFPALSPGRQFSVAKECLMKPALAPSGNLLRPTEVLRRFRDGTADAIVGVHRHLVSRSSRSW
jgi:Transposase